MLECNPDLTIKNKKGQTPIDITNSKAIINVFLKSLTKNKDFSNTLENGRDLANINESTDQFSNSNRYKKKLQISKNKFKTKDVKSPKISRCSKASIVF